MEYITVEKEITKKQAIEYIRTTLFRFNYIFYYYNEHKELLAYNTKIARLSNEWDVQRFPLLLDQYIFTDEIEDLNINGCKDFLLKLKQLSEKFNLNISIPDDLKIIDIIPKFIRELKTNALRINKINLDEIEKVRGIYLKQSEDINLNRLNKTELEINIQKKHEYDELLRKHCDAYNQRQGIEMAEGRNPSFKGQWDTRKEELTNIIIETDAQMKQILQDYPLIKFLDGSTKPEKVQKQVNNLCDKIHNSLLKVDEKIVNDEYPIWEFTDLINYIFEKNNYKPVEKQEVIEQLNKWKSDKYKKDLFITIGSITLSIVAMFIPGGASLTALIARTLLQTGDVVLGAISAKEDIEDGILEIQKSYADIQLSPEQIDFIESSGVDKATQQFVIAFISAGFIIFDAKDVVKSGNLIKKCSELDDVTRAALKQSKRFGEKALQELSIERLNCIKPEYMSFFGNNSDIICDLYKKLPANVICDTPEKLLTSYSKTFNKFDDFAKAIGKNTNIATIDDKVRYLQETFENLTPSERGKALIPGDAKYVKGFGPEGRVEYLWPDNLGLKHGTDAPIVSKKGEVMLPDEITRVGELYGKNFSDGNYSYSELAIPYKQNDSAFEVFKINKKSYVQKIDAIANGDLVELNRILKNENLSQIDTKDFTDIKSAYNNFISDIPSTINCNPKYGIKGIVAEWWSPDGTVRWLKGGKPQFVMPLSGRYLKLLGIIS